MCNTRIFIVPQCTFLLRMDAGWTCALNKPVLQTMYVCFVNKKLPVLKNVRDINAYRILLLSLWKGPATQGSLCVSHAVFVICFCFHCNLPYKTWETVKVKNRMQYFSSLWSNKELECTGLNKLLIVDNIRILLTNVKQCSSTMDT